MGNSSGQSRVAVIGCGHWGRNLVRVFAGLGALASVSDTRGDVAEAAGDEHGVPSARWQEILEDQDLDAVAIAVPAAQHAELALGALNAGKHLFVEKPLALRVSEAVAVCEAADAGSRVLMVGHLLQYHPAFLRLRELVEDGVLGKVRYLYSNRLSFGRIRREENILWSFAPHDVSMILSLVGNEPVTVRAEGGWYLSDTIADVTTTHLTFPDGVRAHIFVSWLHPYKEHRLVVVGEEGMAVFDDGLGWENKLSIFRHRVDVTDGVPLAIRADGERVELVQREPLEEELSHFLHCVRSGETPRTDGREGIRVLRILEEAEHALVAQRA